MRRSLAIAVLLLLSRVASATGVEPSLELPPYTVLWAPPALAPTMDGTRSAESWEGDLDEWTARTAQEPGHFPAWIHAVALQLSLDRPGSALRTLERAVDAEVWPPEQQAQLDWLSAAAWLAQESQEEDILAGERCLQAALHRLSRLPRRGSWDLRRGYAEAWLETEWGRSEAAARFLEENPELPAPVSARLYESMLRASSQAGLDVWSVHFETALAHGDTLRARAAARIGLAMFLRYLLEGMDREIEAGLALDQGGEVVDFSRIEGLMDLVRLEHEEAYSGVRNRMETVRGLDREQGRELRQLMRDLEEFTGIFGESELSAEQRFEKAIDFSTGKLERCEGLGSWYELCRWNWGLGWAYDGLGRREARLAAARAAMEASRRLGDPYYEAALTFNYFAALGDRGAISDRLRFLPEIVDIADRYGILRPQAYAAQARALANLGDLEGAFRAMSQAYREARVRGDLQTQLANENYLVYLALASGDEERLAAYLRDAYEKHESIDRSQFPPSYLDAMDGSLTYLLIYEAWAQDPGSDRRAALISQLESIDLEHEEANKEAHLMLLRADTAMARGELEEAGEILAGARAWADSLGHASKAWQADAMEAERRQRLGDASGAAAVYERALTEMEHTGSRLVDLEEQALFLTSERGLYSAYVRLLLEDLEDHRAAYRVDERARARALRGMESESDTDSPVRSLEVVQAALDPGQLLLQYRLDEERTILWIVESGGSRCTEIEVGRDSLELTCRRWRAELEAGLASPLASELGELLLDPAAPELERGEQLIVVGDSPLSSIPFSLLRWQGRRLLETHSSSFEVSGSSHCTLKARQGEGIQEKVVAVAYDGAISPPYLRLPVLPAVDAEARSVAALLPDSVLLVGDDARPLALRAALPGTRILHIAAHAGLDAFGEPFILLAPENQRPGLLYRDEIAALPLRGVELVSLAGCETSRLGASEILGDLSGLGAAILMGGARGLMASLWRVDDQSTREFMALFYGELLGAAHSPADALRMAQLAMMADAGFLERDWGAFCVWGP